jgi:hypothetical protein
MILSPTVRHEKFRKVVSRLPSIQCKGQKVSMRFPSWLRCKQENGPLRTTSCVSLFKQVWIHIVELPATLFYADSSESPHQVVD